MTLTKSVRHGASALMLLALSLAAATGVRAAEGAATNSTEAILQHPGFREGLVWLGPAEPSESESSQLLVIVTHFDQVSWPAKVEQFLTDHPHSPWTASLHHAYASFCHRSGRTTKALDHWEAAWEFRG